MFGIRLYKAYLSRQIASSCRFEPSCSRYGYEAIERYGLARGSWMALKRIFRCHPFSLGGYDPVP
ncbi:MAG: membrane protein insertion efficiency factor YidD [Dehalococcoidia bacterium]|nr:membrane protein insertion efficiency factor YidD [Dehalococcoidia bacterium]